MTTLTLSSALTLNNGVSIPMLGLGLYQTRQGSQADQAIRWALEAGYRHFDSAALYGNERSLGDAIRASGISREEVFVTTKLWNSDQGYNQAIRAFNESLEKLGFQHVDLYLIHWPVVGTRSESWRALETLYGGGKIRAIGVSNYLTVHLNELLANCNIRPAVNQIELSPFNFESRRETVELCRAQGIALEAYSPLTRGCRLKDPALAALASRYGKSPAQILVRWALQESLIALPKSANRARIRENADVFDFTISAEDMDLMRRWDESLATGWDPTGAL